MKNRRCSPSCCRLWLLENDSVHMRNEACASGWPIMSPRVRIRSQASMSMANTIAPSNPPMAS